MTQHSTAPELARSVRGSGARGRTSCSLIGAFALAVLAMTGCSAPKAAAPESAPAETPPAAVENGPAAAAAVTKLEITDTKKGKGAKVKAGDTVTVHYSGYLMDGTKFDSSLDRGQPFDFVVGQGLVIKGWDEGLVGMQVGGKRVLIIPSDMGYGPAGTPDGTIPPDAPLKFEIELLGITPAAQ